MRDTNKRPRDTHRKKQTKYTRKKRINKIETILIRITMQTKTHSVLLHFAGNNVPTLWILVK